MVLNYIFLLVWVLAGLGCSVTFAAEPKAQETTQKRMEEQNRQSLQPTEAVIAEQKPAAKVVLPQQVINQEYLRRLMHQAQARKVDAIYVVMVLLGKQKDFSSFTAQFSYLKQEGFFPEYETGADLNEPLRKGELVFMLYKTLNIRGGLHIRLFGLSERYALSELIYQEIMVSGHQREIVTGRELVYSFIQSANFLTDRTHYDR